MRWPLPGPKVVCMSGNLSEMMGDIDLLVPVERDGPAGQWHMIGSAGSL